jgi:hypothetical protein
MVIVELLNLFDPDPDVLLRETSRHVSDAMLESISAAHVRMITEQLLG